jgi:hypothetical protein
MYKLKKTVLYFIGLICGGCELRDCGTKLLGRRQGSGLNKHDECVEADKKQRRCWLIQQRASENELL